MFSNVNSAILVAMSIFVAGCATDAERAEIARKNSLSAAIVRSMPDSGSYQRSIAAKQQERREKVINKVAKNRGLQKNEVYQEFHINK
mgnify:CR=1 FL=1